MMSANMAPSVMDAAIIGSAQKVEHYEICGYGTARTFATQLGLREAAALLQETLDEEYEADDLLTRLATGDVNARAERGNSRSSSNGQARNGSKSSSGNKKAAAKSSSSSKSSSGSSSKSAAPKKTAASSGGGKKAASGGSSNKKAASSGGRKKTASGSSFEWVKRRFFKWVKRRFLQ